jgi:hypothetical protein
MRNKILGFLAALLVGGNAAADPRAWVIDGNGLFLEQAGQARRAVPLPEWQWAGELYACAPAVALGPLGEAVVTSNVLPVLWRVDPVTLAVSVHRLELDADHDKDVGFSAIVYSRRHSAWFAYSELHGSLWRIDARLRRAQKIAASHSVRGVCALSLQRQERLGGVGKLYLHGKGEAWLVNLAPDERSAYVLRTER